MAVTRAHEGEGNVFAPQVTDDVCRSPHCKINAVWRTHDAYVGNQMLTAAPQLRNGGLAMQALLVRAGTDDSYVIRSLAPSPHRNFCVGGVRGNNMIGGVKGRPLQREQSTLGQRAPIRKA